jgi:hypothetical protein
MNLAHYWKKTVAFFLAICLTVMLPYKANAQTLPFRNNKLPIEVRVKDLLDRLTIEE